MSKLGINTGVSPNDNLGDTLLQGAIKINSNFNELYAYIGDGTNLTAPLFRKTSVGINTLVNVGIGTTDPTSKLTVTGDAKITGVVTALSYYGDGSGLSNISNSQWVTTAAGIHTLSNVGIGTTNPTSKLTVGGDVRITGVVTATSFYGDGSGLSNISNSQWVTTAAGIHTLSNVGIGTTNPTSKLTVTGDAKITGVVTATSFYGDGSGLSNISNSQWVTTAAGIHTLSNVGIGTTDPTSKLTVTGDAKITGVVTAIDFNSTSDINLKGNISLIEDPLEKIIQLNGVNFEWKESGRKSLGVIAQEVEKVLPELVSGDDIKTVNYNGIIGLLIECVKKQQKEIESLKLNNK